MNTVDRKMAAQLLEIDEAELRKIERTGYLSSKDGEYSVLGLLRGYTRYLRERLDGPDYETERARKMRAEAELAEQKVRRAKSGRSGRAIEADDDATVADGPWDRLESETSAQFLAFSIYRDLGSSRTIVEAWRRYCAQRKRKKSAKRSPDGTFTKWTSKNDWVRRASAYDEHRDKQRRGRIESRLDRAYLDAMDELLPAAGAAARALAEMVTDEAQPSSVRRQAAKLIFDYTGIKPADRVEVDQRVDEFVWHIEAGGSRSERGELEEPAEVEMPPEVLAALDEDAEE